MSTAPKNEPGGRSRNAHLSDPELMLELRDGSTSALETLMGRYWGPLIRYAVRLLDSPDNAEDLVQAAFTTVWNDRAKWKPVGTVQAFLYRVVRNGALQERRRNEVRERKAPEIVRAYWPVATPFDVTAELELKRAVQSAIRALPPRRREAFVLTRYHQLSLGEVAEIMGVSPQTVANHVSMAVAELRRALAQFL